MSNKLIVFFLGVYVIAIGINIAFTGIVGTAKFGRATIIEGERYLIGGGLTLCGLYIIYLFFFYRKK